jgi:hypothetical protein
MAFYFVTGKLGNGKSLVSVSRIREKLQQGLPVATNIDLNLSSLSTPMNKSIRVIRVPDKPTLFDLESIGVGNESYDESKNGLLVLDECGTWFNARNWQDKSRAAVNNWFLHARKLGWDVILIVQDISIVDNQAREALSEFTAFCKRLDNIRIPIIGGLLDTVSAGLIKMPKLHIARVVYGSTPNDPLSDRWVYKGTDLYTAYDTKQIFISEYEHGPHSVLPPYYQNLKTYSERNGRFYMRLTKIYFKKFKAPLSMALGIVVGVASSVFSVYAINERGLLEYREIKSELQQLKRQSKTPSVSDLVPGQTSDSSPDVLEMLNGYRIVGYAVYSQHSVYDIALVDNQRLDDPAASDEPPMFTTDQLSSIYDIEPNGPCHVRISVSGHTKDLYCL